MLISNSIKIGFKCCLLRATKRAMYSVLFLVTYESPWWLAFLFPVWFSANPGLSSLSVWDQRVVAVGTSDGHRAGRAAESKAQTGGPTRPAMGWCDRLQKYATTEVLLRRPLWVTTLSWSCKSVMWYCSNVTQTVNCSYSEYFPLHHCVGAVLGSCLDADWPGCWFTNQTHSWPVPPSDLVG